MRSAHRNPTARIAGLAFLFLGLASAQAIAQPTPARRLPVEVGAFSGANILGDGNGLGNSFFSDQVPRSSVMFGIRGAWRFGAQLAVEPEFTYTPTRTRGDMDQARPGIGASLLGFRLHARYMFFPALALRPLVVAGTGLNALFADPPQSYGMSRSDVDPTLYWGIGAQYAMGFLPVVVRLDLRQGLLPGRQQVSWAHEILLGASIGCATHTGATPLAATSPPPAQTIELEPGLRIRTVASNAFEITHELPWPANSLLVAMADGTLVLAGIPYSPEATRRVLAWARARFGERKMVAINNGFHVDNLGGNAALLAAHIPIHGSDLTVTLLRERGEKTRQHTLAMIADPASPAHAAHVKIPYLPPDHIFPIAQGLIMKFGSEEVRVIFPGPSQAPDKVAVYFPTRALLYGGCMVLAGNKPGNTADANLATWPEAVRALTKLPVSIVIPGHGDRLDPGLLQHTIDVLEKADLAESRP